MIISPVKMYSVLGNPKSLVPLAVKDSANCIGLTSASYITGKSNEAKDRFIDETGTEAIWLGGIPLYKKIIDKTVFKYKKLDSKYDIRNLENKDIFEKTKKYAPTEKIAKNIEKIGQNAKTFKALNIIKVLAATGLALISYNFLTDLKQKYTEKQIEKKIRKETKDKYNNLIKNSKNIAEKRNNQHFQTFSSVKNNKKISFKGGLSNFLLNPVKNMYILDGGITTERLTKSRNKQEFAGYAIKEGGFLFFMYYLGQKIQNTLENRADKKYNKSISLDAKVLEDDKFKKLFKTGEIEKSLKQFPEYSNTKQEKKSFIQKISNFFIPQKTPENILTENSNIYDFIHNNPENAVVKAAKKSGIIENYKEKTKGISGLFKKKIDTGKIDTRKYISIDDLKNTHKNISKLYSQFKASGEDVDTFFNGVRKLKRNSIKTNIGTSILALGVIVPGIMLAKRILSNDKEFSTEKIIREKIEQEYKSKNLAK